MTPVTNTIIDNNTNSSTNESRCSRANNFRRKIVECNPATVLITTIGAIIPTCAGAIVLSIPSLITKDSSESDNLFISIQISSTIAGAILGAVLAKPIIKCVSYLYNKYDSINENMNIQPDTEMQHMTSINITES